MRIYPAIDIKDGKCVRLLRGSFDDVIALKYKKNIGEGINIIIGKLAEANDLKGIIDIADNDINEVSGGQLQRACICRSMINNPKMIFADEPTGALNRTSSDEVMDELAKLNKDGTTVMLVTHDVKVAAKCTRVMYIVDGNIKGEYNLDKYENSSQMRERERALNNWLLELGW